MEGDNHQCISATYFDKARTKRNGMFLRGTETFTHCYHQYGYITTLLLLIHLMIIFAIIQLVVWSMKYQTNLISVSKNPCLQCLVCIVHNSNLLSLQS